MYATFPSMKTKPTKQKPKALANRLSEPYPQDVCCTQPCGTMNRRRSIPSKEVDEMLEQQAKSLRKEPTLYDQRAQLIEEIDYNVRQQDMHLEAASNYGAGANEKRQQLKEINRLLSEELKQDPIR